jgi:DNA-binding NarL/FixJ family response regulator
MEEATVAVCSADPFIVLGIERLLDADPRFTVVAAERSPEARVAFVVADEVDDDTLTLLSRVVRFSSAVVVLIVDSLEEDDLAKIVECRVVSVLARSAVTADTLRAAIDQALAERSPKHDLLTRLMGQLERSTAGTLQPKATAPTLVSPRERDLLKLLANGLDTAEIATRLAYSERTIKNIVHGLLRRLELRNRAHAVAYAMRVGAL